jgi:hypothetical protein
VRLYVLSEDCDAGLQSPAHAGSSLADFSTRYVPPKRLFTQDLHGATSQKTAFLTDYEVPHYAFFRSLELFPVLSLHVLLSALSMVFFSYQSTRRHGPQDHNTIFTL